MEEWYLRIDETEYGPYSLEQLVQYIGEGRVSGDHGVRQGPSPDWMKARQVPALAELFTSSSGGSATAPVKSEAPPLPAAGKPRKKSLLRRPLFWIILILSLLVRLYLLL